MARCAVKIMKQNCLLEVARRAGHVARHVVEKRKHSNLVLEVARRAGR
ncbi:hypothetical protein A2U01_0076193, partial [Trifolium medium]|nr:hypothetical protein [Trifolium medium]